MTATEHTPTQSPENTQGVTAVGVLSAHVATAKSHVRLLLSCIDAYLGMEHRPEVDSPPDFAFLALLSFATNDPGFRELARQKYEAKLAQYGGPQALGEDIRTRRGEAGNV